VKTTVVKSSTGEAVVESDGRTVWVNGSDGCCLGRFSRFGIDVHKDYAGQMNGGQCLDCKPGPLTSADWDRFVEGIATYYGIRVAPKHRPDFLNTGS